MGGVWGTAGGLVAGLASLLAALAGTRGPSAEPRGARRWVRGGVAAGAFVAAGLVVWVLGPGAQWWLEHIDGVHGLQGKDLAAALDAVRGRAMALGTGVLAGAALYYTAGNTASARRSADAAQQTAATAEAGQRRNLELAEQGQVTDRYTRAIEQLGSESLDVRLGGIYALERIARDSARDHPAVMAVLAAFLAEHSHDADAHVYPPSADGEARRRFRPDLQAAFTVLGRRTVEHDTDPLDLTDADLSGARMAKAVLNGMNLTGVRLANADLAEASLDRARLAGADLSGACLVRATLVAADLTDTRLYRADLAAADLEEATLCGADLADANMVGANLSGANLYRADLADDVNLTDADLTGADLRRVRGLTPAHIRAVAVTDTATRF